MLSLLLAIFVSGFVAGHITEIKPSQETVESIKTVHVVRPIAIDGIIMNHPRLVEQLRARGDKVVPLQEIQKAMISQMVEGSKSLTLIINTPGGAYDPITDNFLRFMDNIQKRGVKVTCVVNGMAASMGAVILSHCGERLATIDSVVMVHSGQLSVGNERLNASNLPDILKMITELNTELWALSRAQFNDDEYFDKNFVAERLIPVVELSEHCPNTVKLVLSLIVD